MSTETKPDITSREKVSLLITNFYSKVRADALLSPVFSHVDWDHHTPIIVDFWCMILLGERKYEGNPFSKHVELPVQPAHFQQWLKLFRETIDENFSGEKAEEAKTRAETIANVFQFKMGLL